MFSLRGDAMLVATASKHAGAGAVRLPVLLPVLVLESSSEVLVLVLVLLQRPVGPYRALLLSGVRGLTQSFVLCCSCRNLASIWVQLPPTLHCVSS